MSEELIQRNLVAAPETMGAWNYYNIGSTTLKALKEAKIILNKDYEEYEIKKPDAIIVKKPQVIAAIEYKQPKELRTKKQIESAIMQQIGTARALGAKVFIVTDGKKTFWLNPLTGNEVKLQDNTTIDLNFDKSNVDCIKLINKIIASINGKNDILVESAMIDPLPLAQRVWQDLWAVSGATPENCLYTFVELFIFKYLSDLGVLTGMHSFANLRNQYKTNTEGEVLEYYADTIRKKIKELFPWNPKDNTTIINGTIFVSKDDKAVSGYATVFKKILDRFDSFGTLENIDHDFKSKLFETFLKESISKKNWGQFFTPLKVVRAIVNMADINAGMKICDPFCGVGKFLLEPILHDIHKYFHVENGKLKSTITLSGFDKGFDKDEQKTIILAKANMLIYMSALIREHSNITNEFADLFNQTFLLQTNSILGTLANPVVEEYDLIFTNPPYVMSGSSNLKEEISKQSELKQHFAINAMGVEGLSMEWIVRSLKPGGKAFIVVPDGVMNRSNDKRLREYILEECIIDAIISLPLNTFFTTNKKTYIMALTKKNPVLVGGISTKERQKTPVFTYLCSEIGETRDVNRFDIEQNDLDAATTLYNMFKGVRGELPIDSKRCKIVCIDEFYREEHWSIERWWTRDEKVVLGIEDEVNVVSIEGFISIINDTASTISEFEEPLRELIKKKSESTTSEVELSELIDFTHTTNSSKFTKSFVKRHPGEIPVYGASKHEDDASYGYIDDNVQGVKYFTNCLTWNIDGSIGLFYRKGQFSLSEKVIPLVIKDIYAPYVSIEFLRAVILAEVKKDPFTYTNKGGKTRLGKIKIQFPLDENGFFDLKKQSITANQFNMLNEMRVTLDEKYNELMDCNIAIDLKNYMVSEVPLSSILLPIKGKSKYTKKYGDINKGEFPVYSASSNRPLTYINSYDYEGSHLSWSTNGFAGMIAILDDKFSINGDRGILLPKREDIDIQYLKYILQPIFRQLAKGRKGDKGADEFTKLYPSMIESVKVPLPIKDDGSIDLTTQQEIAKTYVAIDKYRSEIIGKIRGLKEQQVLV